MFAKVLKLEERGLGLDNKGVSSLGKGGSFCVDELASSSYPMAQMYSGF